jgi:Trk K+ transport system NAD-binding subunit
MNGILAGPDADDLATHLREQGVDVTVIEGVATRPKLEEAGVHEADIFVLTDIGQATAIPIVKDLNDAVRAVVYDRHSLPEFVAGQTDLAVDPELLGPDAVAEELAAD